MILSYIARRAVASIPALVAVTLITFLLLHAVAGTFVPGLDVNSNLTPAEIERLRRNLGLDAPLYIQYGRWFMGLLHGDFGSSLIDGTPVMSLIAGRLPNTLLLTGTALALAVIVAIPMGVTGATRRGSLIDQIFTLVSVCGVSIPSFWLGLLLILTFSVLFQKWGLPWLPATGASTPLTGGDIFDRLAHLVMPATVLAFSYLAIWSRFVRSSLLDVLAQDYVRTARAKGMKEGRVIYVHALRNALIPLATIVGLELRTLVGGAAIVEVVFSWPGIGRLTLERALQLDYTTVLGLTTFAAVIVIVGNLLADILYAMLNPRIRHH